MLGTHPGSEPRVFFEPDSSLGLACLASIAVGMHGSFEEASSKVENPMIDVIQPDPSNTAWYTEMFELYKRLETSLEPFFQQP